MGIGTVSFFMSVPLHFYCDETSHRAHRFAAVGGLACRPERLTTIDEEVNRLKAEAGYGSEIKWEKVSQRYLPFFRSAADYFFSLVEANQAHFHVVICDFHAYDHRRHNDGAKDKSVSKTYYQLFLHRLCKLYGGTCELHFRPDGGSCTSELPRFLGTLNRHSRERFSCAPVRSINVVRDSSKVPILGLNDLILGAIASHRNERHLKKDASAHKTELADYIRQRFGLADYSKDTPFEERRWTLWNWEPQPER